MLTYICKRMDDGYEDENERERERKKEEKELAWMKAGRQAWKSTQRRRDRTDRSSDFPRNSQSAGQIPIIAFYFPTFPSPSPSPDSIVPAHPHHRLPLFFLPLHHPHRPFNPGTKVRIDQASYRVHRPHACPPPPTPLPAPQPLLGK